VKKYVINYWHQAGEYIMEKLKKDLSIKSYLKPNPGMLEFITTFFPASADVLKRYGPEERLRGIETRRSIKRP